MTKSSVKLSQLRPLIGRLPPMLGPTPGNEQERDRYRADTEPWRALYKTARWKRLRIKIFVRDHFTCKECGHLEPDTSKLVCDHIKRHGGDEGLFWPESNLQTMCKTCHDSVKQRLEKGANSR